MVVSLVMATPHSGSTSPASSDPLLGVTTREPNEIIPKKKQRHARAAIAGACAGAIAKTVVAPIERVKILMQLQASLKNKAYIDKNSFQVASMIYRREGVLAFWRGNFHNVLQQAGTSALNFMFMDYYKAITGESVYSSFLCGGMAGGTATTILYPIQFLRTRLAADVGSTGHRSYPNGMRDVLRSTLRVDGVRGLYQGYGIALAGIFLYRSLHMGGYDAIKTVRHQNMTWTEKLVAAQFVSLAAGTVCYPIDSVRRRLMMQAGRENKTYRHALHAFQTILRDEGFRGFYRGLGPNLVRSLGAALLLVSYDALRSM
jgi:solute carrier family 25 (adenine nucleotide translocator) protein 4/5/6/31